MPIQPRRSLPATTGFMECVDRSGTGPLRAAPLAALLHGKLYSHVFIPLSKFIEKMLPLYLMTFCDGF